MKAKVKLVKRSSPTALLILLLIIPFLILNVSPAMADPPHWGYSNERDIKPYWPEWMKLLSEDLNLTALSIPGTHDTMTYDATNYWAKTQSAPLWNQLRAGIRALDIRVRDVHIDVEGRDRFKLWHGKYYLGKDFEEVLDTCTRFLETYPSETILMRLAVEGSAPWGWTGNKTSFLDTFLWYVNKNKQEYLDYFWGTSWWGSTSQPSSPKLGDIRKKIVILQSGAEWEKKFYGLHYDDKVDDIFEIQRRWNLNFPDPHINHDDHALNHVLKWFLVKQYLEEANEPGNADKIYVNCLNGVGNWELPDANSPFRVASGHKGEYPATDDYGGKAHDTHSISGFTSDYESLYFGPVNGIEIWGQNLTETMRDNFSDDGQGNFILEGMNELTYHYLKGWWGNDIPERVGIIYADFPGHTLIEKIIKLNKLPFCDVKVSLTPSSLAVEPGYSGTYTVNITNIGNLNDTYALSLSGLALSWYTLENESVAVSPSESTQIMLNVTPTRHWSTAPGDYNFTVTAISLSDLKVTDHDNGSIAVLPFHETQLFVVPDSFGAQPGDTVTYTVGVQNLGNVRDDYNVSAEFLNPGGLSIDPRWTTLWPHVFWGLDPGNTGTGYLEISVPDDWAANGLEEATYNFTVSTVCQADSTANDTVERTLHVMVGPRTLSITLSGEFDYAFKEPVPIKILALVKDVKSRQPVSNADVNIEIYAPSGDLLWSDQMVEMENGNGVYIWESEETIQDIMEGPHWQPYKGVYTVYVKASYNAGPISYETLEFHIDPPAESASIPSIYLVAAMGTALVGLFVIQKIRKKKTRIT
jgi:1-phosphatidylinositol phosphodiesterase